MCGIAGVIGLEGCPGHHSSDLFLESLKNRGPDAQNLINFTDSNVLIGHTRLSIIDVENSHQPMTDKTGRFTITFNGEIYNHREMRDLLKADGEEFITDGDTEVLLKLWIRQGYACLTRLRGQFAFAIYDSFEKKLSLITDQFGILPLYFLKTKNCFHFSSSLRNLIKLHSVDSPISIKIENQLEYRAQFGQSTLYEEIHRLQPGQLVEVKDSEFSQKLWYAEALRKKDFEFGQEYSKKDMVKALSESLTRRVHEILVADVPICLFLSSGLDSNYIRLKIEKETGKKIYGIFAMPTTSKGEWRELKSFLGAFINEVEILEYSAFDWWDSFKKSSLASDTPLSEPADPIVCMLAQRASKNFKVAITGEGADEIFQGYRKYALEQLLLRYPRILRSESSETLLKNLTFRSARFQRFKSVQEISDPKLRQVSYFRTFLNDSHPLNMSFDNPILSNDFKTFDDPLFQMIMYDLQNWLPRNLLDRSDNLGLLHSVEVRPFFLDDSILRIGVNSRKTLKRLSRYKSKPLLRAVAKLEFGKELANLPKNGFPVPLAAWFRSELRSELVEEFKVIHPLILELHGEENIDAILVNHISEEVDNSLKIFSIISLSHHLKSVL